MLKRNDGWNLRTFGVRLLNEAEQKRFPPKDGYVIFAIFERGEDGKETKTEYQEFKMGYDHAPIHYLALHELTKKLGCSGDAKEFWGELEKMYEKYGK